MKLFRCGTEHKDFHDMLGDYLAVATDDLSIFNTEEEAERFIRVHAGLTRCLFHWLLWERNRGSLKWIYMITKM